MTALARIDASISSSSPISESIASPVRISVLPTPELSDTRIPDWHDSVIKQLVELSKLDDGWDGFGAGPIGGDVITFACSVLEEIMSTSTPAPHITPMSNEGLMLEWHQNGIDLEIEIEKPGNVWMSFEDQIEHIEEEYPLSNDFGKLAVPIDKLTKRTLVIP